jgi:hypothetical protein
LFISTTASFSFVDISVTLVEIPSTSPKVTLNTLSKVVIPKVLKVGTLVALTTTASANVIGTNSLPD